MTEPFYATDPEQPTPPGQQREPSRERAAADAYGPAPSPARLRAADAAAHYPWSMEAQQATVHARQSGFLRLLYSGLRAVLLLPVRPGTLFPGAGSCLVLIMLITLLGVAGEWWLVAEAGDRFNWNAVRSAWFDLPIVVLGGAWLAQPRGPGLFARNRVPIISATPTPLLHFAAVMLSASVWILSFAYGVFIAISSGFLSHEFGATVGTWLYLAVPLWSYLVAARTIFTMHRAAPISVTRRFLILVLLAAATAWSILDPPESYWEEAPSPGPVKYVASPDAPAARRTSSWEPGPGS